MLGLVDSMLADAMDDALDIKLQIEPINLAGLAAQVVEASQTRADAKNQTISVAAPGALTVRADYGRLWEAIDNLVTNAIKYTPAGGRIDVVVEQAGADACVTVSDSGLGLSPEDIGRLFGRFQRLSAKPTGGESSTGLGLSIVKKIVDLHGGRVSAQSGGPQRGSAFHIALPIEGSSRSTGATEAP